MNVIVANEKSNSLANLDIDVIKSMTGVFEAEELVEIFKNFFFGRIIIDITAIKSYKSINSFQKLAMGLDKEKMILLLPEDEEVSSAAYLGKLVSLGIYNFTSNVDGVRNLLLNPRTYQDVSHVQQMDTLSSAVSERVTGGSRVIGIKNLTDHAGATTLVFMLKRELERIYGETVYALEVDKSDFSYFQAKNMISTTRNSLYSELNKLRQASVVLVDLNDGDEGGCSDVLYLLEPSSIKLNKLIRRNKEIFQRLQGKKIVLNKSLLSNKDIVDFEYEAKTKVFYNIPPLNDRQRNDELKQFLGHLGVFETEKSNKKEEGKIFGLFKR